KVFPSDPLPSLSRGSSPRLPSAHPFPSHSFLLSTLPMTPREDPVEKLGPNIYYEYLSPLFSPIVSTYEKTKHSHVVVEEGLGKVESSILALSSLLISLYRWSINTFYVAPVTRIKSGTRRVVDFVGSCVDRVTRVIVDLSTLSIGVAVIAVQGSLALSVGGASILLDGVDTVKHGSVDAWEASREKGREVIEYTRLQISETIRVACIPLRFATHHLHSFLDLVEGLLENKIDMPVIVSPTANLVTRISASLSAVSTGLNQRAHSHVIDPAHAQLVALVDQTKKSLVVLEFIRDKGEWAMERVDNLSVAVSEWKTKIEEEAKKLNISPEVVLLNAINSSTGALSTNLVTFKQKNAKVFGPSPLFDRLIVHLDSVASSLKEKNDLYQVRDELITQTRNQLTELTDHFLVH
ncbi:hypothetical protein PMAYCL1PPCAC_08103, partial [Pristionchus mayeri]